MFDPLEQAGNVIGPWRAQLDGIRTHASPGDRPPAPDVLVPRPTRRAS
ncbi:hypothetical protein [Methylobacterium sp. J-077]|nr:hypothetical protein [Methylobacterium sp. J-077]MCJ2123335.1 hypothetical protein [Methylobacterium sp. J-077]